MQPSDEWPAGAKVIAIVVAKRASARRRPPPAASVAAAVKRDLAAIGKREKPLASSGLAASALSLARSMDDPKTSPTARAACARALREALDRLREQAPPPVSRDGVDALQRRARSKLKRPKR